MVLNFSVLITFSIKIMLTFTIVSPVLSKFSIYPRFRFNEFRPKCSNRSELLKTRTDWLPSKGLFYL